jgi:hypothetical protein
MDIYAYSISCEVNVTKYIEKHYGEIPRLRGVRFMKIAQKIEEPSCEEDIVYNKYVGTDTIYIHTRRGDCGLGYDDEDSNYVSCGAKEWEERLSNLFLEHITEEFDYTYCTHYFKAITDDDYQEILKQLTEK